MKKFIVAGIQRTGTTYIRTCIDSHPATRCIGEAFKVKNARGKAYGGDLGYATYLNESRMRWVRHYLGRTGMIHEYLDHVYALEGFEAVGFKLMYSHARRFPCIVPYMLENNVSVIHVERKNVLKTLVSVITARARGAHHSTKKVDVTQIELDAGNLVDRLARIQRDGQRWQEVFEGKVPYVKVTYEDFVADRDGQSAKVQEFLGLEPHTLKSDLRKLNPDDLSKIITNYDHVAEVLAGSPFEWCLGDKKAPGEVAAASA
ncbi:MAG: sulfotransferase [Pseudomonadota bacterium]